MVQTIACNKVPKHWDVPSLMFSDTRYGSLEQKIVWWTRYLDLWVYLLYFSSKRVVDPAVDLIARRSPFFLKFHIAAVRLATVTQGGSTRYRLINQIERSIVIGLKQSDCVQREGARHWYLSRTGWGSGGSMRAVLVRIHDCGPHDCGLDQNSIYSHSFFRKGRSVSARDELAKADEVLQGYFLGENAA